MTLHDPHLQQALLHAPDRELAPDDTTRNALLDYAAQALERPSPRWLTRLWHRLHPDGWRLGAWQLAGMSSAVAALLVVVVVHFHTREEGPIRMASVSLQDLQRKADAVLGALQEKQSADMAVQAKAKPMTSVNQAASRGPVAGLDVGQVMASAPAALAVPAQKIVVASLSAPVAAPMATAGMSNMGADGKPQAQPVAAEAAAYAPAPPVSAPTDVPVGAADQAKREMAKSLPEKEVIVAEAARLESKDKADLSAPAAVSAARAKGAAHAAKDIQSGRLRVFSLEPSWPADKAMVDEETGYRVEMLTDRAHDEVARAEVDAYNQAMREWHAAGGR